MRLYIDSYKNLIYSVVTLGVALTGSVLLGLYMHSFIFAVFIFTGVISARNIIDYFNPRSYRNFPVLSGITDGFCFAVFFILTVLYIKGA